MKYIKSNKLKINMYVLILILIYLIKSGGDSRYVILLGLFFIMMINSIIKNSSEVKIDKILILLLLPVFFYFIYTLVISLLSSTYENYINFFKQLVFMATPILGAYGLVNITNNKNLDITKVMFWCVLVVFIFDNLWRIDNLFYPESDLFEGTEAFIFGIFLMYFIYKGNKGLAILSFILMYLGNKRIALFSTIVLSVASIIIKIMDKKGKKIKLNFIYLTVMVLSLIYIYMIYIGKIEDLFNYLNMHMMGRDKAYIFIKNYYDFKFDFYGRGMGYVEYVLMNINMNGFNNLHSDILKIYVELGTVGYVVYMILYKIIYKYIYRINHKVGNLYLLLNIFTIINMFTDNIMIYVYYLLPLYTIIIYEFKRINNN